MADFVDIVIGDIKVHEIHACLGKHVSVAAEHPLVVGGVVAKIGLCPVMGVTFAALLHDLVQLIHTAFQIRGIVVRRGNDGNGILFTVAPQKVEHAH